jgi:hypothetical protein
VILGGDTVTVISRRPALDGAGHPVKDRLGKVVITETEVAVDGCSFENVSGSETTTNVNASHLFGRAFMPPDTDPEVVDAIRFAGVVYELDEPARLWTDELGRPDFVLVNGKHSEG